MPKDAELRRLVETLSQHLGEQIRKEQENPKLEKHLISVALARLLHHEVVVDKVGGDFGAGEERSRKAG